MPAVLNTTATQITFDRCLAVQHIQTVRKQTTLMADAQKVMLFILYTWAVKQITGTLYTSRSMCKSILSSHFFAHWVVVHFPASRQRQSSLLLGGEQAEEEIKMAMVGAGRWTRCYGCWRHADMKPQTKSFILSKATVKRTDINTPALGSMCTVTDLLRFIYFYCLSVSL